MARHNNPRVVTSNLLLNLDFKNSKRFTSDLGVGNLVQNFNYNASTWNNIFPANTILITGIDAPDGSKTAVRFECRTSGSSIFRVGFTPFTPNGTDLYAASFWVRKIQGTTSSSNQLVADVQDANTYNYINDLVTDKWVRIKWTGVFSATSKTFIDLLSNNTNNYILDFWGIKLENITAANNPYPVKDTISSAVFNIYRPQYTTLDEDTITFDRTTAPAAKHGGLAFSTGTGSLTSQNFLYNDHTWEVWFKINDINPGAYSGTESYSTLAVYRGFHSGFFYTQSTMGYSLWDSVGPANPFVCNWTVGLTGAQINQGNWYQIIVTRSGNVFTPYINGVPFGTGSTRAMTAYNNVSNDIHIGATNNVASGAIDYLYYSKNTVANMKMYNRALTADEVSQNFNALRGRFGI